MCGIAGVTGREPDLIRRMTGRIAHRGPDDEGFFEDDAVSLGHRRLAIIDVSARGHQPMTFRDYTIVYNGECYNFRELRQQLERFGDRFETDCDTEVLLHAYARWGRGFLERINGMFALCIYDAARRSLLLARDRLGIKPLYYMNSHGRFAFASEIKALLPVVGVPEIDFDALHGYLEHRFTPGKQTLFRGIQRLNPAECIDVDLSTGGVNASTYWTFDFEPNNLTIEDNAARVRELLEQSVRRCLVSDVPVGAFLSGGLDSSAVVACMARAMDRPVQTFNVSFAGTAWDEARHARAMAEHIGADHTQIDIEVSPVEVIPEVVRHLEEPLGDAATIPTYLMARETANHVKVVLTGEGSDELFGGYEKYSILHYASRLPSVHFARFLPRQMRLGGANLVSQYEDLVAVFDPHERIQLFPDLATPCDGFDISAFLQNHTALSALQNFDLRAWLPNDILLKSDKMTMAHAVEARLPFLDHELVAFAATIPASQKIAWGRNKLVYRRAVALWLPGNILRRKKQGFTAPLCEWLERGLDEYANDLLAATTFPCLNKAFARDVFRHAARNRFTRRRFWTLFFLLAWHRGFF